MTPIGFERRGDSRNLVVLLHAYTSTPRRLSCLAEVVRKVMPNADLFIPPLPMGLFSMVSPISIVESLLDRLDALWQERVTKSNGTYESIILVGHSLGGLLARKLYVAACGEHDRAPFEDGITAKEPRPWAARVSRIVLMAGLNRGWDISHHMGLLTVLQLRAGILIGESLRLILRRDPLIFSVRRGAAFVTELRAQWLFMRRAADRNGTECTFGHALVVQMLGSIDDVVSPSDNIDLVSGGDFVYLDVPHSSHLNVVAMDSTPKGKARAAVFAQALQATPAELAAVQQIPSDNPIGDPDTNVTDVLFVMHGIRDEGHWTQKVARRVRSRASNRIIATRTASYGYFPMLRFILPGERAKKVHWFMDQYIEALALYPNADFSFVGHSHGTYLLARSLELYRCCRFKHVLFAGSVVRSTYDWMKPIASKQVAAVANYVATADWVVAWFPNAMEQVGWQDLGGAGHSGFRQSDHPGAPPDGAAQAVPVFNVEYMKGSHGAAIREENWDAIAEFVLNGPPARGTEVMMSGRPNLWVKIPSSAAWAIWLVIIGVAVLGAYFLWQLRGNVGEWQATVMMVLYLLLIWQVLTNY